MAEAAPAADVIDALAEALLALPGTLEVHVRRWPHARRDGFTVTYWPRSPVRWRSHVAASWDSEALRRAADDRRPVTSSDPAELPAGVVGRLPAGTPVTVLALGADAQPWGVAAVAHRATNVVSETAVEAMATLGTMAGLGLQRRAREPSKPAPAGASRSGGRWDLLSAAVSVAERRGSSLAILVIQVAALAQDAVEPARRARLERAVAAELCGHCGDPQRVSQLGEDVFAMLLPETPHGPAHAEARRVVQRLAAGAGGPAQPPEPANVVVAVAELDRAESPEAFLGRALSLIRPPQRGIRGAAEGSAGPPPNLMH